jgi:tetratricopeptide (TPR) repeat protein
MRRRFLLALLALAALPTTTGCEALDGRERNRKGSREFREMQFIDAAAQYEKALTQVNDPIIHYNLGLTYSRITKPGSEKPVYLGMQDEFVCEVIPNTKKVTARVCVKEGDRHFNECDELAKYEAAKKVRDEAEKAAKVPNLNETQKAEAAKKLEEAQEKFKQLNVCSSSYQCVQSNLCAIESNTVADMAAQHYKVWLQANPQDEDTRKLLTAVWLDTEQFDKAIGYWQEQLNAKPNDTAIMGNLAGIYLKSGDWRKSIEWYKKVADQSPDPTNKVAALQFIGNVAWSKLNSKTLLPDEVIEIADSGLGALQKASDLQPKNPKLFGLMASIYNFRALAHGAMFAAAADRASAQDLQRHARVLTEQAKKAQETGAAPPTKPNPAAPSATGSGAQKSGG